MTVYDIHNCHSILDRQKYRHRLTHLTAIADIEACIKVKRYLLDRAYASGIQSESDTFEQTKGHAGNIDERQTLEDMGGFQPYSSSSGPTMRGSNDLNTDFDPTKFFERPIQIADFSITPPNILTVNLPVWDRYTLNPSVRSKLRNYSYLKGTMHVRVAISGTPFHAGRVLLSYQPYGAYNESLIAATNVSSLTLNQMVIANFASQAPGAVTMDVRANQPVDLEIPFISPLSMGRLFNTSAPVSSVTSFTDFEDMGDLIIMSMGPLSAIGANITPINFNVYAWMTDVKLGAPTNTIIEIQTESEMKTGPIERVATNALKVYDILAPALPAWALPSRMGLSAIKAVSTALGWSRPAQKIEYCVVKNLGFSNGAHTIGWDTVQRVTLDPAQEMTVDPRVCGVTTDDMGIAEIARREGFFQRVDWDYDQDLNDKLITIGVNPTVATYAVEPLGTTLCIQPIPAMFAVQPFESWRGEMVYRFEVVCTNFHRGKLAVIYEPNATNFIANSAVTYLNKQHMQVIDIQETTEFEIRVEWCNQRQWCGKITNNAPVYTPNSSGLPMVLTNDKFNGVLYLVPFTKLQSPDDTVGVFINCYARCENMQVNYFQDFAIPLARQKFSEGIQLESDSSLITTPFVINPTAASANTACVEFYGEQPVSFRSLLKRYAKEMELSLVSLGSTESILKVQGNYQWQVTGSFGTSFTRDNLFNYLRLAYLGFKGGIRRRIYIPHMRVDRLQQFRITMTNPSNSVTATSASYTGVLNELTGNYCGSLVFIPHNNGGIEFEVPNYMRNLFLCSFNDDPTPGPAWDTRFNRRWFMTSDVVGPQPATSVLTDIAAGEDFTFIRFQGAPYYTV